MRKRPHLLLEVVAALVITGIVLGAAVSTTGAVQRSHRRNLQRTLAVLVLDNTVERLAAHVQPVDVADARRILELELDRAPMPQRDRLRSQVEVAADALLLSVRYREQRLAQVALPLPRKEVSP